MEYRVSSVREILRSVRRVPALTNWFEWHPFWPVVRSFLIVAICAQAFSPATATVSISLPYNGVNFGTVNPNAVAPNNVADRQLIITNNGDENIWINAASFAFWPSAYNLISQNCPPGALLQPGSSCTATIRFNPAGYGNEGIYGTVGISISGAQYLFSAELNGTAYTPPGTMTLSSSSNTANFGTQAFGTVQTQTLILKNTGGTAITASPPTSSTTNYVITDNSCNGTIMPGSTCNVQVTFVPSATGTLNSTITIPNTGVTGTVAVTGSGVGDPGLNFGGGGTQTTGGTNVEDKNAGGGVGSINTSGCPDPDVECHEIEVINKKLRYEPWDKYLIYNGNDYLNRYSQSIPLPPLTGLNCGSGGSGGSANGPIPISAPNPADDLGINVPPTDLLHTADPIHAGLGNKSHPQTDYSAKGGYALAFIRTYQAQALNSSALVRQKMGPGWYSNWDKSVNLSADGTTARVLRGDGSSILFIKQPDGTWTPPTSDIVDKLTRIDTYAWTYKTGGVTENYEYIGGYRYRLSNFVLSTGETYVVTYETGLDRLKTVTDPAGRVLTFNYDAQGRLSSLVDPASTTTTYTYDDGSANAVDRLGRLMSVTFPDNRARRYKYDLATRKFALTSIATFENGIENTYVTFSYDESNGRSNGNSFGTSTTEALRSGRATVYFNTDGSSVAYDPSRVVRDAQGNYNLITAGQYPTSATVKRNFTTILGAVLPTSIEYRHICAACPDVSESFTYNADGRLISHTDRKGFITTSTYTTDGRGLLASTTQASGTALARTTSTTWHATLPVPLQVVEPTRTTTYTYDSAGRMLTMSIAAAGQSTRTTTYTYNAQGWRASVDGPRTDLSDITSYTYHASGNVYQVTNPKGQVTTYNAYNVHGNVTQIIHADGTQSTFQYDARGRLLSKTEAGQTTTNTYVTNGLLNTTTDPYGGVTTYLYDDAQRLTGKDQSNGEKIRFTPDNAGRTIQTQTFDALNNLATTSSTVYDGLNRVQQTIDANNKVTNYSYDANGNVTAVLDPNNLSTTTQYDALNRPILVTDPNLKTVATTYTVDDKVATVQDPNYSSTNNSVTAYTYNGFGEQTSIQSPDTGTTTMTYNNAGLVQTKTDARGKLTTYAYDVLGRVIFITVYDGGSVSKSYDVATNGVGRLASVNDSSGTTSYTYDAYGRVSQRATFINGQSVYRTVTYARDAQGRITSITYPSGNVLGMTYSQDRVTNMSLNGSALISGIEYFPLAGPESWLLGANVAGVKDYTRYIDQNSRIEKYSTPTGYRKLTFDNGSRISGIGDYLGVATTTTVTQAFGYDTVGRLTSFSGFTSNGNAQANINQTQSFTYDNNGNRLTSALNNTTTSNYSYQSGNNRLSGVTGGFTKANTYDLSGNLTDDGSSLMTYDTRGRMITANAGGLSTSYLINHENLRVKKSNSNETRYFVYDDAGHMMGEYDTAGNTIQELFWLGDAPVAIRGTMPCLAGGGCTEMATAYVWADHLNTPRELTRVNASNQHVSIWKWDSLPFGDTVPNANPSGLGIMTFNHRFPGQYFDKETGLHQNWHRDYDPRLGRYITSDPIGLSGGINTYGYGYSRPTQAIDPTGLDVQVDPVALLDGIGKAIGKTSGELLAKFGCKKAEEAITAIKGLKQALLGICKAPGSNAYRTEYAISACTFGLGVTPITGFGEYIDTCVPIVKEFAGSSNFAAGCASLQGSK